MRKGARISLAACVLFALSTRPVIGHEWTLRPGECFEETVSVHIPPVVPKADVLFGFDLTGSMSGIIATAKARATEIMTALGTLGVDIQFGVASYMDYSHAYNSYGYAATYGSLPWDYAYSLDQPITSDTALVQTTINNLALGWGGVWTAGLHPDYVRELRRCGHRLASRGQEDPLKLWRQCSPRRQPQ